MRAPLFTVLVLLAACSSSGSDDPPNNGEDGSFVPGPDVDLDHPPASPESETEAESEVTATNPPAATTPGPTRTTAPVVTCAKNITVIFTVGVPGKSKMKSNGCWTPVITDGAAVASYRKCSTSNFAVGNDNAPNWAYDDTSPAHSLTQEKTFLAKCAAGSTGDGFEFMAYRGGWRLLGATNLKAYFAELYGSSMTDIDSLYYVNGVYKNNAGLASKSNVFPMINFGPPASANLHAKVGAEVLKLCKTIPDKGYFGMYNASWASGMAATDPRLLALQKALDTCTAKK